MSESAVAPLIVVPPDGWTVDDLDALPESHVRHELTDGALTVSPSPSSLHQVVVAHLVTRLEAVLPEDLAVTQAVEIRFGRRLTRIPDVLVVRTPEPGRHWFSADEVVVAVEVESPGSHIEDRVTKPTLYARFGIPSYWRVALDPPGLVVHRLASGGYTVVTDGPTASVTEPFAAELGVSDLLPRWAP